MDYKVLKEKFFLGTSTREEEEELRRYLMGDDLPAEAFEDKELLLAMLQPAEFDCSEAMEEVSAMIDGLAAQEAATSQKRPLRRVVRYIYPAVAVAAVLALFFMVVPYSDNGVVRGNATDGAGEIVVVNVSEPPGQAIGDDSFVLSEPDLIPVLPPEGEKKEPDVEEPLLADDVTEKAVKPALDKVHEPVVQRTGNLEADTELLAALSGKETANEEHLIGKRAGYLPPLEREGSIGDNTSTSATSGDDTYTDPQDAIKHIDALFAIFSDAASGGVEEQRTHFKRFVALNDK